MRRSLLVPIAILVVVAIIVSIERQPASPIGNLAECAAVIGLLCVLAFATRGIVRDALVVVASLVVGLTIIDGALLVMEARGPAGPPVASTDTFGISRTRPAVGWGAWKPGVYRALRTYPDGQVVYDARITIDATLNRQALPSADTGAIAFFGDSFIYGDGLADGETLPQAFSDLNGGKIPVWNFAFSGWSPAPNLAGLRAGLYKPLLKSPRHFILFTGAFHVERTACKGLWAVAHSPKLVLVDGEIVDRGWCGSELAQTLTRFAQRFALYDRISPAFSRKTRNDVETYLKIVETFVATAKRDYGVETTILFKTMGGDFLQHTGYSEATVIDALRKSGADVLVETLPPSDDEWRYEIKGDGHPTALANRLVAAELEAHLQKVDPAALAVDAAQK